MTTHKKKYGKRLFADHIQKITACDTHQRITLERRDFGVIRHRVVGLDETGRFKVRKLKKMFKVF
jgi:hypothetical protein